MQIGRIVTNLYDLILPLQRKRDERECPMTEKRFAADTSAHFD